MTRASTSLAWHLQTQQFGKPKPPAKYALGDLDGLSLAVSPQGGKSWHFRYYWNGKQKRT
jgi:hypothetical protein